MVWCCKMSLCMILQKCEEIYVHDTHSTNKYSEHKFVIQKKIVQPLTLKIKVKGKFLCDINILLFEGV